MSLSSKNRKYPLIPLTKSSLFHYHPMTKIKGDASPPPADPPTTDVDEPADVDTDNETDDTPDPVETTLASIRTELDDLKLRTEKAEANKKKAEAALELERKAHAELKRKNKQDLSEKDQLDEDRKELESQKAELNVLKNTAKAQSIIAPLALSEKEFDADDLACLVSDDEERTVAVCELFVATVTRERAKSAKAEREKVLKEFPQPTPGDGGGSKAEPSTLTEALTDHYT